LLGVVCASPAGKTMSSFWTGAMPPCQLAEFDIAADTLPVQTRVAAPAGAAARHVAIASGTATRLIVRPYHGEPRRVIGVGKGSFGNALTLQRSTSPIRISQSRRSTSAQAVLDQSSYQRWRALSSGSTPLASSSPVTTCVAVESAETERALCAV